MLRGVLICNANHGDVCGFSSCGQYALNEYMYTLIL